MNLHLNECRRKFSMLDSDMIIRSLANMPQITFEVTEACNLKCMYCGYGEFYEDYDIRKNNKMDVSKAILILEYLNDLWNSNRNQSYYKNVYISFYGGEPLLNMSFIEKIVNFVNRMDCKTRSFIYSITTNAILLDKYMDYLVGNNFNILISLDGDKFNNSYRIDINGNSSFEKVVENIDLLMNLYPNYFIEKVNFNSVLHNRNSVDDVFNYIKNRYGKIPSINELNSIGIKHCKKEHFMATYRNVYESICQSENYDKIEQEMFLKTPSSKSFTTFLWRHSGLMFNNYVDLLYDNTNVSYIPTGTCVPFSKKMFITVNGKILPCEKIGHQYAVGQIINGVVDIDCEKIANKYNEYFKKLKRQCCNCYNVASCVQCVYNLDNIDDNPVCYDFMTYAEFLNYYEENMRYMQKFPDDYYRILRDVEIE